MATTHNEGLVASMRPPEFTGGNMIRRFPITGQFVRFNEAAGIHRRKQIRARGEDVVTITLQ